QACRWPFRSHLASAAQALGLSQGGADVGHADVEDDVGRVACAAADAARNASSVGGRDAVDEAVVRRPGDRFGDRGAGVELPAEQLTEVVPELFWVLADDLEVHNRVFHEYSLRRSLVVLAMLALMTAAAPETHRQISKDGTL